MHNKIDHFAVGAQTLEQGVAALRAALGVEVPRGGKHGAMSTHNCVMQAGNESFLEILAIDPDAPAPGRARWFSMDDPKTKARLAEVNAAVQAIAALGPIIAVAAPNAKPATCHTGIRAVGRTRRSATSRSNVARCSRSFSAISSMARAASA